MRYTNHALEQMLERGVTPDHIDEALRHAIEPLPGIGSSIWLRGLVRGRILRICTPADNTQLVITVVWEGG